MRKISCFFAVLLLFLGCSQEEKSILTLKIETQNITSLAKETSFPIDSIGKPVYILSMDDHLILASVNSKYALSIYNTNTGNFQSIGRMGRGANEIQNVGSIGVYPSQEKHAFYVLDNYVSQIYVYTLKKDSCQLWKIENVKGFTELEIDNNFMIGKSGENNRYLLKDTQTGYENFFGDTKYSTELEEKTGATMDRLVINKKKKRLGCFSYFGEAYEIIDYGDPQNIKFPFYKIYLGMIPPQSDTKNASSKSKKGFGGMASNDEYIFALCGDKTINEYIIAKLDIDLANNICVFDWNGKYIKRLICDKPIMSLNIDKEKDELFAIVLDDDFYYKVVSFPLAEII